MTKLARFAIDGSTRVGKVEGDRIVDLTDETPYCGGSMRLLLENYETLRTALERVQAIVSAR